MEEVKIGRVTHYFGRIGVAAIKLEDELKIGDTIHIKGKTTDFTHTVESMQIEHSSIEKAQANDEIGMKVPQAAREGDSVYLVKET